MVIWKGNGYCYDSIKKKKTSLRGYKKAFIILRHFF